MIKEIIWAGHSAVFLKAANFVIAIDPWLEGNPATPANLKNPEQIDLIILTHGHFDHAGEASRYAKSLGAKVVANYELASLIQAEGVPETHVIGMNKGGSTAVGPVRVSLTNAFHSSSYDTPKGTVYAGEPCGIVVSDATHTFYHAGDTCLFSDMSLIGKFYTPDIAFLPCGDRFTMGPKEAAWAAKLVGSKINIPIHHSTFDLLTGRPEDFEKECLALDLEAKVLKPGERYMVDL